jgi:hydroxymethylglutaryl-CoA reductase
MNSSKGIINPLYGFSKLSKLEKIDLVTQHYFSNAETAKALFQKYWHSDLAIQKTFDEFSENTLTNFIVPLGVVPNLLLNGKLYCVPMAIEESSVVAASARSANFWLSRGGFHSEVMATEKVGQVHFIWKGESQHLVTFFESIKEDLINVTKPMTENMEKRGGGMTSLSLVDKTHDEPGYFQLLAKFETCDAMGANFINSILEVLGKALKEQVMMTHLLSDAERDIQIIMAILSNYTPDCRVKTFVECPISELHDPSLGIEAKEFAEKFAQAIRISKIDVTRATTHNKGIFNGIDAVVVATGNDYRAIEACGHAYAARDGQYRGLSDVSLEGGIFRFSLEIPLALGTVGGLTSLHPLSRLSLDLLGRPSASLLMSLVAATGLAQNFAAVRSLVTSGIQKGHMKMHLMNILNHLEANQEESEIAKKYFESEVISYKSVRDYVSGLRDYE